MRDYLSSVKQKVINMSNLNVEFTSTTPVMNGVGTETKIVLEPIPGLRDLGDFYQLMPRIRKALNSIDLDSDKDFQHDTENTDHVLLPSGVAKFTYTQTLKASDGEIRRFIVEVESA